MKIKEIMTRDVISVFPDMSAKEALATLQRLQISGLPVIDKDNKLVGMFTEKEVLSYILPSYIEKVGRFVYEENPKMTKKKFADLEHIRVAQLMRRDVLIVQEDATLCEVAKMILVHKVRRFPVVDKTNKVVGIVCRYDVMKAFEKEASFK